MHLRFRRPEPIPREKTVIALHHAGKQLPSMDHLRACHALNRRYMHKIVRFRYTEDGVLQYYYSGRWYDFTKPEIIREWAGRSEYPTETQIAEVQGMFE